MSAKRSRRSPQRAAPIRSSAIIDLSLEEDLDAHFLAANMGHNDDAKVGQLLSDPNVMIGASDGGAHILSFSTYV
ncbi:MAG: hypothetical protein U5O39_07970 [Gammaproteobacteria bacterium]|nr:hypothetical protein [Gammaproteobacteria bacterium]